MLIAPTAPLEVDSRCSTQSKILTCRRCVDGRVHFSRCAERMSRP